MNNITFDRKCVLHVVDHDIKFSAATFPRSVSSTNIWNAILTIYVATYVGHLDMITFSHGPQFQSKRFRRYKVPQQQQFLLAADIERKDAHVKCNSSLREMGI